MSDAVRYCEAADEVIRELQARLAAAERVIEIALRNVQSDCDGCGATLVSISRYEKAAAVPVRGEGRAPEGGSTPPAAIDGLCDECGGQFSDLAGHKSLGVQTHPWLDKRTVLNSVVSSEEK